MFHRYDDFVLTPIKPVPSPNTIACAVAPYFGAGGMAFGASGRLYVALMTKSQLSILDPDGSESLRFPPPAANRQRDVPVNAPFSVAFDGRGSLLVANTGDVTLDSDGCDKFDVGGGGDVVEGDPHTFVLAMTGRLDGAPLPYETINVYA